MTLAGYGRLLQQVLQRQALTLWVALATFALFAFFLLGYFPLNTKRLFTEQVTDAVNAEIAQLLKKVWGR